MLRYQQYQHDGENLEHSPTDYPQRLQILDNIAVNLSSARGRIQDTDFAQETSNLAKSQIMQQAATAMLAQANASKQTVLALIQ